MSASELEDKVKAKRFRAAPTHRWSSEQTRSLLEEVRGEIKDRPESFEKPIAQKFYSKLSAKCPLLANINWKVMKSKMRYLKGIYMEAVKWRSQTGAGLIENGEEESVKDYIQNICPFFEILDEIFGLRKGMNPTVIIESSNIEILYEDCKVFFYLIKLMIFQIVARVHVYQPVLLFRPILHSQTFIYHWNCQ
ncbi:uncharacterized protein LOC125779501 [Bactrocera dorsalis]|uniref:Uncharacterized protein LOC125779501 n=1 Tax=Bactrocera dorsalis TaxID=27457 RepID=A0ABM3K5R4_BACDO|nr:uncharacterized protein LOC125779501 [Bactrocera dorsalis]